jgi:toxin ParE1/3/4
MRVEWSDPAREDLNDLVHYISRDSVRYAQNFAEKILMATRRLNTFAESGRYVPEDEAQQTREIIVQGYRVMYAINADRGDSRRDARQSNQKGQTRLIINFFLETPMTFGRHHGLTAQHDDQFAQQYVV